MRDEILKTAIKEWVEKIGKAEAVRRLVLRKVSVTTADKVCGFRYHSTIGNLLAEVLVEEMAKDGVSLAEAS